MGLKPAIFLDRDGVLCENRPDYIKNTAELRLFPWTTTAMRILASLDAYIFVFTNQSAIGRGLLSFEEAENINRWLKFLIGLSGGRIDDVFMCPHRPEAGCWCRKPGGGMIMQAWEKYPVDPGNLVIVGDQLSDLVEFSGRQPEYYLVQSGLTKKLPRELWEKVLFMPTVLDVAKWHDVLNSNIIAKTVKSI